MQLPLSVISAVEWDVPGSSPPPVCRVSRRLPKVGGVSARHLREGGSGKIFHETELSCVKSPVPERAQHV